MKNETIVDRVVARLKAAPLGDLITEEDLHDIVKTAIPKVFFEPRSKIENPGSYHQRTVEQEPAILEVMRDLLKDSAKQAVEIWLLEHADEVAAYWTKVCDAGLLKYVQAMQDDQATAHLRVALNTLFGRLNEERMKMGLPGAMIL